MRSLTKLQGLYYVVGGLWPLVHFRSFEAVVGPKPDRFQTEVAAVLFTVIGSTLLSAATDRSVRTLAAGSALGTAYVDLRHRRQVRHIFWAEAAAEFGFAAASIWPQSKSRESRPH